MDSFVIRGRSARAPAAAAAASTQPPAPDVPNRRVELHPTIQDLPRAQREALHRYFGDVDAVTNPDKLPKECFAKPSVRHLVNLPTLERHTAVRAGPRVRE